jgi:hypothetical protein
MIDAKLALLALTTSGVGIFGLGGWSEPRPCPASATKRRMRSWRSTPPSPRSSDKSSWPALANTRGGAGTEGTTVEVFIPVATSTPVGSGDG